MTVRVTVYDDDAVFAMGYAERIKKARPADSEIEVSPIDTGTFQAELTELTARQVAIRSGKRVEFSGLHLDRTDVFVVDYDLIKTQGFLTGQDVSYAARGFSSCGLIISLNEYGRNYFDLTLLGHHESYADLNIGEAQLDNKALWGGEDSFRPWYWPHLPWEIASREKRMEATLANLDTPLPKLLGLERLAKSLPKTVARFFPNDFLTMTPRSLAFAHGALRVKDRTNSPEVVSRMAAARLSKWLETLVLPGQDLLVDAPHLASRLPSLLSGNPSEIESWNSTTRFASPDRLGIASDRLADFEFKDAFWLSRPAWLSGDIANDATIQEVNSPWAKAAPSYVFAEDASKFFARNECQEYKAPLDSPYSKRYVRQFDTSGLRYTPMNYLTAA